MNNIMLKYSLIMALGVFISSLSQVLLKKAAVNKYKSFIFEYINPKVLIAYIIFFIATILSVFAYKVIPLSLGPIIDATGYIYVTLFGVFIFKEKVNNIKIIGIVLIVLGIVIYSVLG